MSLPHGDGKLRDLPDSGKNRDGLDDEEGTYNDDEADDGTRECATGGLELLLIAAGEEEVVATGDEHDEKSNTGEGQDCLDDVLE